MMIFLDETARPGSGKGMYGLLLYIAIVLWALDG